jgi:hypothetical protein
MKKKTVFFIVVAAVLIVSAIFIFCQKNSEITSPTGVSTLVLNSVVTEPDGYLTWGDPNNPNTEPVCVGEEFDFTLTGWDEEDGSPAAQIQLWNGDNWIQMTGAQWNRDPNNFIPSYSVSCIFDNVGTELLRFKIGSGGFTEFQVEVVQCGGCETWQCETAFGGDSEGPVPPQGQGSQAWWFYYDATEGHGGVQVIWAGQTNNVGTVELVDDIIHINLTGGWELLTEKMTDDCIVELDEEDNPIPYGEPVKIGWYDTVPTEHPVPGQLPSQGTTSDVTVPSHDYYVIHLDVRKCLD